ncbi:11875_t:CDS:2 [Funneliformis caledonium]|uniref:11875_t:CDS:1 n=1 Tax=Funneliformis caledonium TaxID=1117310 RepID=A0A9N9D572_9GLOM|nr:11875_t:CDS:2 [Funneliformis caledonium]
MNIVTDYYNDLNTYKNKNLSLEKSLTFHKEKLLEDANIDLNDGETLVQNNEELKSRSRIVLQIAEQQNKLTSDIFILTKDVLRKEILLYRDKISIFNHIMVDFKKEDQEYILKLEKILNDVKITVVEFELLLRMKMSGNNEFHQGDVQTLDQARRYLETSFPNELEVFRIPLRKLLDALKVWL